MYFECSLQRNAKLLPRTHFDPKSGADPGWVGGHDPQTTMFPIANNSVKETFHMKKTLMASQSPVLDYGPQKSSSGSAPVPSSLKEFAHLPVFPLIKTACSLVPHNLWGPLYKASMENKWTYEGHVPCSRGGARVGLGAIAPLRKVDNHCLEIIDIYSQSINQSFNQPINQSTNQ